MSEQAQEQAAPMTDEQRFASENGMTVEELRSIINDNEAESKAESTRPTIGDPDEQTIILDQYVRRRKKLEYEEQVLAEQFKAAIRDIQNRLAGLEFVYGSTVREITRRRIEGQKTKTVKLAFGQCGFRTKPAGVEVTNPDLLLAKVKEAGLVDLVKVTEAVSKTELNRYVLGTGDEIPGCRIVPTSETFFVK